MFKGLSIFLAIFCAFSVSSIVSANPDVWNEQTLPTQFVYDDPDAKGFAVVSDMHLMHAEHGAANERAYGATLDYISQNKGASHLIVNGDIFHAPGLNKELESRGFDPNSKDPEMRKAVNQVKQDMIVDHLKMVQQRTGKKVLFNVGNHDAPPGDKEFLVSLEERVNAENINGDGKKTVIGTDFNKPYAVKFGAQKVLIGHAPIATSEGVRFNAGDLGGNQRAIEKVVGQLPRVESKQAGWTFVNSDSHTPTAIDHQLGIINTGSITRENTVAKHQPTFTIHENGKPVSQAAVFDDGVVTERPLSTEPGKVTNVSEPIQKTRRQKMLGIFPARGVQEPMAHLADDVKYAASVDSVQRRFDTAKASPGNFIKDQPILAFKIEEGDTFDSLPRAIQDGLRANVDGVDYKEHGGFDGYLKKNVGSIISLQTKKDGTLDFYVVGKDTPYKFVDLEELKVKNGGNVEAVSKGAGMADQISSNPRIVGAVKMSPVQMVRASDLGIDPNKEFALDKYGGQTKPAGADAFFVVDDSGKIKYMVNADEGANGRPIAYVPKAASVDEVQAQFDAAKSKGNGVVGNYIKDQPILAYKIQKGDTVDSLPDFIKNGMGQIDGVDYSSDGGLNEYLKKNAGSIISLQTKKDGTLDVYVVGKDTAYDLVDLDSVKEKNAKNLNAVLEAGLSENDLRQGRVVGAVKTEPVQMVRASDIGIDVNSEFVLDKYGGQTKPAGVDAYFVVDESGKIKYMVNADEGADGKPIAYNTEAEVGVKRLGERIAGDMHTDWLARRRAGADAAKPNPKEVPLLAGEDAETALKKYAAMGYEGLSIDDGKLLQDINRPVDEVIPSVNHKLNGAPAADYARALYGQKIESQADVEKLASQIHEDWMKHNSWQRDSSPQLFRPYNELTAAEKLKDVDVLEGALRAQDPEAIKGAAFTEYKEALNVEELGERIAGDMHTDWLARRRAGADAAKPNPKEVPLLAGEDAETALKKYAAMGYEGLSIDDGKLLQDINRPVDEVIPSVNHKLNGAPAADYARALYGQKIESQADVEKLASQIHEDWMKHNSWQRDSSPQLFRPYNELTAAEKLKDVDVLEGALRAQDPEAIKGAAFTEYKEALNVEELGERIVTDGIGPFGDKLRALAAKCSSR